MTYLENPFDNNGHVNGDDVLSFLTDYEGLENDGDYSSELKLDLEEDYNKVNEFRHSVGETDEEFSYLQFISEDVWESYAADFVESCYDIPDGLKAYFDYEKFAEDLQTDYSQAKYNGTTYYYQY